MKKDEEKKEDVAVTENNVKVGSLEPENEIKPSTPSDSQNFAKTVITKQLSIKLPEDVHRKLKSKVALEGGSAIQVVTRLVMEYVEAK